MGFAVETIRQHPPEGPLAAGSSAQTMMNAQQHGMVGVLNALSALGEYAALMFEGLREDTAQSLTRIKALSTRIDGARQLQEATEKELMAKRVDVLLSNPRADYASQMAESQRLFDPSQNLSHKSLTHLYDRANPPPDLAPLDPLDPDGESSLKKYTNPDFFLEEWIQEQLQLRENAKAERRARRQMRREAKQSGGAKRGATEQVQVKRMMVAKYDPITGEKYMVDAATGEVAPSTEAAQSALSMTGAVGSDHDITSAPDTKIPKQSKRSSKKPGGHVPPPPPDDGGGAIPPPPPEGGAPVAPPPAPAPAAPSGNAPPAPPPAAPDAPPPAAPAAPAPPNAPAPPAAPAPPPAPGAPPPPAAPAPPTASPLLAALAGGAGGLKKAEIADKPVDSRSGLLDSIRQGTQLKKVERSEAKKEVAQDNSVASILARRIAIAGGSSESESSDDDWDDDDWD